MNRLCVRAGRGFRQFAGFSRGLMGKRVVLAMSGGVDSSVAAHLLKEQGYEVIGLFMRTGAHAEDAERRAKTCCSATDAVDAQNVADRLDIPFYALDFERDFARIMDQFADEYAAGRTPNPCVMCNIWLKFGKLWAYGKQVGADFVATGHYARIAPRRRRHARGSRARVDRAKDQSYVLFGLRRELLPHVLFPVGGVPQGRDPARSPASWACRSTTSPTARRSASSPTTTTSTSSASAGPSLDTVGADRRRGRHGARRSTRGSRRSRSASGGGWGSPSARRDTSCRSSRRRRTVTVGPPRVARASRAWRPRGSTGKAPSPGARPCLAQIRPSTGPCRPRSSRSRSASGWSSRPPRRPSPRARS